MSAQDTPDVAPVVAATGVEGAPKAPAGTTSVRDRRTVTALGVDPSLDQPQPVTLIGAAAMHVLARAGYRVAGRCTGCGAALTAPVSVARRMGPRCSARHEGDAA